MSWDNRRKRDTNIMFAVHYEDGRTAYITISPKVLGAGDHVARSVARERQAKGEIPEGKVTSVKRVR
jgi:uncharacterized membrane protein